MTIFSLLQSPHYPQKVILEKLLCHFLHISKQALFTENERNVNSEELALIEKAYHAYTVEKKPLEYILEKVTFLGVEFKVGPTTLIPRPETEYMIEAVNEHISENNVPHTLLDIGTGCGVLGLSTLWHNPDMIMQAYLSDLSTEALTIAKENYNRLFATTTIPPTDIHFLEASLLDHPTLIQALQTSNHTLLVANLPYIPEQLFEENTDPMVKNREPKMAFVGGEDGLDLYRIMFDQLIDIQTKCENILNHLKKSPLAPFGQRGSMETSFVKGGSEGNEAEDYSLTLFLEMMTRQVDILRQAYEKFFIFEEVKTFHFNIRILKVTISENIID